jgi:hypothetical protein
MKERIQKIPSILTGFRENVFTKYREGRRPLKEIILSPWRSFQEKKRIEKNNLADNPDYYDKKAELDRLIKEVNNGNNPDLIIMVEQQMEIVNEARKKLLPNAYQREQTRQPAKRTE